MRTPMDATDAQIAGLLEPGPGLGPGARGNRGAIDTRSARTMTGLEVGRWNWCICPNGQALRQAYFPVQPAETVRES